MSPLFCLGALMIILFWGALANQLLPTALLLIGGGWILGLTSIGRRLAGAKPLPVLPGRNSIILFFALAGMAFLCALSGRLSVVDDYAFWAIISKSIAYFNQLPTADTTIFARHLTYTPGMALVHYFFYGGLSGYNLTIAYFAQNLLLVSLLFALTDGYDRRTSGVLIGGAIIILVLFSGSIFQKLRVDHFLYLTTAVVLWTHFRAPFSRSRLLVMATSISLLYLIKEVGFLLAAFLLMFLVVDCLYDREQASSRKKTVVGFYLLLFFYLIAQKLGWDGHCATAGFRQFHSSISLVSIQSAFDLTGNSESRHGFILFFKAIFLGGADRLNTPYLIWYLLLAGIWYRILCNATLLQRKRYFRLFSLTLPVFVIYLAMNYVMQLNIFGLGTHTTEPTSLERYINIFLCWCILFTMAAYVEYKFSDRTAMKSSWPMVITAIAVLLLAVTSWPEKEESHEQELRVLIPELSGYLDKKNRVCITPGNVTDNYLGFRLLYHLFPTHFNVDSFPGRSGRKNLDQNLATCDYLLVYRPDKTTRSLFSGFTTDALEHKSLFRVVPMTTDPGSLQLKRVY